MRDGLTAAEDSPEAPDVDAIDGLSGLDWVTLLSPRLWLGHETPEEFLSVSGKDVLSVVSQGDVDAAFAERFIDGTDGDELLVPCLLDADVACVAHALSALLSLSNEDARSLMPPKIRRVINGGEVPFDHIGIEVFGKLEWYIELFSRAYAPLGINVVGERIFPSVQVRRALQYDENLADVRIARVFFSHGENEVNLEVFEATQCWKYTALRQAALYAHLEDSPRRAPAFAALARCAGTIPEPVGHVAFRVADANTVESIQAVLLKESKKPNSTTMRPYVQEVFFNPSDGSTNTKFVVSQTLPSGLTLESQIVEILSYEP
jgi:hypothetical protein